MANATRESAAQLAGEWSGSNKLWLEPGTPVRESDATARIGSTANGQFLQLAYDWADQGSPHSGLLVLRIVDGPGPVDIVWVDSFHTMRAFMQFARTESVAEGWNASTTWSVGDGPDWGWRIEVTCPSPDELLIRMFITTPTGEESPAVETRLAKQ